MVRNDPFGPYETLRPSVLVSPHHARDGEGSVSDTALFCFYPRASLARCFHSENAELDPPKRSDSVDPEVSLDFTGEEPLTGRPRACNVPSGFCLGGRYSRANSFYAS
jgi:hypothetical protein